MISTRSPVAASAVPRLIAVVVLPTPPFWLATASTRGPDFETDLLSFRHPCSRACKSTFTRRRATTILRLGIRQTRPQRQIPPRQHRRRLDFRRRLAPLEEHADSFGPEKRLRPAQQLRQRRQRTRRHDSCRPQALE